MKWVLIIIALSAQGHVGIEQVEFEDKAACMTAAKDVRTTPPPMYFEGPVYFARCYPTKTVLPGGLK